MTIEKTGGPAPRGLPQVPVEVTDDGYIRGIWPETQTITQEGQEIQVAQEQLGGKTYTGAWYQYCGVESQENIEPDYEAEDNLFRAAPGKYDWMDEVYDEGERIHIDDFDDYDEWGNRIGDDGVGKPASVTWRSQNAETALNVNVIRSSRIEEAVENSGDEWLEASTDQGSSRTSTSVRTSAVSPTTRCSRSRLGTTPRTGSTASVTSQCTTRSRSKRRCSSLVRGRTSSRQTRGTPKLRVPTGAALFSPLRVQFPMSDDEGPADGSTAGDDAFAAEIDRARALLDGEGGSRRSTSGSSATARSTPRSPSGATVTRTTRGSVRSHCWPRTSGWSRTRQASRPPPSRATRRRSRDRSSGFRPAPTTSLRSRRSSRVT